jgi:hypothetical protein
MKEFKNPTIVVATYSRPESLRRLLDSIKYARYNSYDNINLIISIDGGHNNNELLHGIANDFIWQFGEKRIINHEKNLGLRNHIIACGDLVQEYDNIIVLEDDLVVSKNFYIYTTKALRYYKDDKKIAGISLYSYRYNENAALPFQPLQDGSDVFFAQVPSSWGQAYNREQWENFKAFYKQNPKFDDLDKLPENVKKWPETSWKKYFYKYIVEKDLYFVQPIVSMTSNYGDVGIHYTSKTNVLQVSLDMRQNMDKFIFQNFNNSVSVYDAYFELLPYCYRILGCEYISDDVIIDLYDTKPLCIFEGDKWLTSKKTIQSTKQYSCTIFPIEENIIRGDDVEDVFSLVDKKYIKESNHDKIQTIILKHTNIFFDRLDNKLNEMQSQINVNRNTERCKKIEKTINKFFPVGSSRRIILIEILSRSKNNK